MSAFYSIGMIMMFLFAGIAAAKLKMVPEGRLFNFFLNFSLFMLLFFMGFRIGRNEEISKALKTIGIVSVTFAFATTAGTALVLYISFYIRDKIGINMHKRNSVRKSGSVADARGTGDSFIHHLKDPLKLVSFVIAGFAAGTLLDIYPAYTGATAATWLLNLLLFMIGAQLVRNNVDLRETLAHPETAILPLGTIAGSLLGGLIAAPFLALSPGKALALASGFGWYSLSGVIITDLGDPILGSAGFLINLMREGIALVTIPFIAGTRYPAIGIGVAGATSMDVTLPLIEKSCGDQVVPLSISSGAILSLAVPFLVPLFFQAG